MKRIFVIVLALVALSVIVFAIWLTNGIVNNRKLFEAIENNDSSSAKEAVEDGAFVNMRMRSIFLRELVPTNPTPLVQACRNGNEEIILLLLENGADVNKQDNYTGNTPLLAAAAGRKENRFRLARMLIEEGADIHISTVTNSVFMTSLFVSNYDSPDTVCEGYDFFLYLMGEHADMSIVFGNENALTYAAHYQNENAVRYLIEHRYFEINSRDDNQDTALIVAAKNDHIGVVRLLLELGADAEVKSREGKTAYDYAVGNENSAMVSLLMEASSS